MVLCKIGKYYNQVKFQFLWPRLKVGSSTVMFTVRIFGIKSCRQKNCLKGSICRSELT